MSTRYPAGCENTQANLVEDDILIKHQILETQLHGNVFFRL